MSDSYGKIKVDEIENSDGTLLDLTTAVTTEATTSTKGYLSAADKAKLDGIEAGAEVNGVTSVNGSTGAVTIQGFSTANNAKLDGIETGATADQTKADIDALNVDADTLDGQHGSYYTGYADTAVASLVDSSPSTLDTLNELAAALGDDPNFATTVTNSIGTKLPLAGGQMTGNIAFSGSQTVDGRDLSADGSKLDGISAGAEVNAVTSVNGATGAVTVQGFSGDYDDLTNKPDGSGSGLDADKVDGLEATSFLRSDANATYNGGMLTIRSNSNVGNYWATGIEYDSGWKHTNANSWGFAFRNNGTNGLQIKVASEAGTNQSAATYRVLDIGGATQRLKYDNYDVWHAGNSTPIENAFGSSAPSSPSTGDFWVDTTDDPPELKSYDGTAWVPMGSSAPTVSAPIINGVTLAEDNTSGARFTSKGFTATINMLNDGAPISQKAVKGKVTAAFETFPAMPAASSNSSSSYANGSSLTVLNRWQVDADGVRIPVNEPGRRGFLTLYRYAANNSTAQSFYFSDDMDMEWYNSGTLLLSDFGNQTTKPTYTNIVHPTNNNAITLYNAYTKDRAYVMYWDANGAFQVANQLGGQVLTDPDNPNSEYFQWSSQTNGSMKRMDKYPSPTTTTTSNGAKNSLGLYNVDDTFAVGNGIIVAAGRSSGGNNYRPTIFTRPVNFGQNSGPTSYFFGASSNRNINFIKYVKGYFWLVDNSELFRSSTGAQSSWTSINTSYNGNGQKLKDITVDQNGHLVGVFVQNSNGSSRMMKSNNFGATWVLYGSLSNPPTSEYQSVFVANNRIYASVHTHSATINWAKVNTQTVTVSSTGGDYNEFNVGDLVKPQGSTDSGDVGKIESISGTSIGLDSQYLYQVGDVIEATNSTGTATATRYLVISGTGAISTHQASDPGYVTLNAGTSQTITFPATFPTGETPDDELPSGTTIQVDIQATNSQASDTYPSNTLTPS